MIHLRGKKLYENLEQSQIDLNTTNSIVEFLI